MLLSAVFMTTVHAQDIQESESAVEEIDSLAAVSDSIINELRQEINELKLRELIMQQQIDLSEKDDLEDSLRRATLKASIDSLRSKTAGAPLVVNGDTLLFVYARKGGMLPEARVENAEEKILKAGKRMSMFLDSIYIYESDMQADIMIGDEVLLSVTDMDALWNDTERMVLAVQFKQIIERKINELHDEYGLKQKLKGFALALLIISCLVGLIWVTLWLFGRWKDRLALKILKKIKPWQMKNYVLMDIHKLGVLIFVVFNLLKLLLILVLVLVSIPLLFSIFPETKDFTFAVLGYLWNPVKHILRAVVDYIPNLFQIIVIVLCFRYVIKLIRYFANEIANENLKITGFYPDWAMPTFVILRILLYSFMLVMIWPLLPKSDSEIFQGVSVFIGIIVSLGSTSIVGNIMAGLVMTYMRPFRVGDYVCFGDTKGEVVERTILVTRIRTLKNELVTIPNSNLMGSQISNFTFAARKYGIIIHTKITIGYDEPWEKIEKLLLLAAEKTEGIKYNPKPFVNVTALDDFYVEYEINAFTDRHKTLPRVYSALHSNILDSMHGAGVEIMSPSIFATRPNIPTQIPPEKKDS